MEFSAFLKKYQILPLLTSKILLTGEADRASFRVQIARWVKTGNLIQLKRGVYAFAAHFQKIVPAPYFVAATLTSPSYVSLEKALEFHKMIPEAVFPVTSVTTKRPGSYKTPLGRFDYHHVHSHLFWGYASVVVDGQFGFMACPEKALLDLFYLRAPRISRDYFDELRLQNFEKVNSERLLEYGRRFGKPGMLRAARMLVQYIEGVAAKEKVL